MTIAHLAGIDAEEGNAVENQALTITFGSELICKPGYATGAGRR